MSRGEGGAAELADLEAHDRMVAALKAIHASLRTMPKAEQARVLASIAIMLGLESAIMIAWRRPG